MKIQIDLTQDQIDLIVRHELATSLDTLQADFQARKDDDGMAIFHTDKADDLAEIIRHIESLQVVLKYHSLPEGE